MANMSYCRFQNTLLDLKDCLWHLDDKDLSQEEQDAKTALVDICKKIIEEDNEMNQGKKPELADFVNIVNEYRKDHDEPSLDISKPEDLREFYRDFTDLANYGREPEIFGLNQEQYHDHIVNFKKQITANDMKLDIQQNLKDRMVTDKPAITKGMRPR